MKKLTRRMDCDSPYGSSLMDSNGDEMVSLSLSKAQALVLFDFLTRFSEQARLAIEHQAEERVLWDMLADLEKVLI